MPQRIKEEGLEDDGKWQTLSGLGNVRTGPRGRGFCNSISQERHDGQSGLAGSIHHDRDDRSISLTPGEADFMARLHNAQENPCRKPEDMIGPMGSGEAAYRDSRRAPKHNRSLKRLKGERDDESVLFCSQHRIRQLTPLRSRSPTPPPPPPEPFPEEGEEVPLPPDDCQCPIDLHCTAKGGDLIDCRPLVPILKARDSWTAAQGEYDPWSMPTDNEEAERFASPEQIIEIVGLLQQVATTAPRSGAMRNLMGRIRGWIITMQKNSVQEDDLNATGAIPHLEGFLADDNQHQREEQRVPWEIYEDLRVILEKWRFGDFGVRPHRAFHRNLNGNWVLNPDWPFRRQGQFFGHGHLTNGQRFIDRRDLLASGGHAAIQAGIAGTIQDGAWSVVIGLHDPPSRTFYADVDCGPVLYYIGTALAPLEGALASNVIDPNDNTHGPDSERKPTPGTRALMRSYATGEVVRVFRSWRASEIVPGRPDKGYRYDGLYKVVDYECLNNDRQIHRFKMVRLEGQGPIRSGGRAKAMKTTKRKRNN